MLFDAARDWLKTKGMEAMDGPVNFGSRDAWWGLLVEGYEYQPLFENPYNPPYYKELFENYGFKNYFNQNTYIWRVYDDDVNQLVYERVNRLMATPGYRFAPIGDENLYTAVEKFRVIYNKAWAQFTGVQPMSVEEARKMADTMRPIVDRNLIYFAYFNDEPIGFFIMVPDLNRLIGKYNGKFGIVNKLYEIMVTNKKVGWINIGANTQQLMLHEEGASCLNEIANTFGLQPDMFSQGATFDNKEAAKKAAYQDLIIPDSELIAQALTYGICPEGVYIKIDFSHVSCLQEDKASNAQSLSNAATAVGNLVNWGLITPDEARLELSNYLDIDPEKPLGDYKQAVSVEPKKEEEEENEV